MNVIVYNSKTKSINIRTVEIKGKNLIEFNMEMEYEDAGWQGRQKQPGEDEVSYIFIPLNRLKIHVCNFRKCPRITLRKPFKNVLKNF